jgi:hypothetical protein
MNDDEELVLGKDVTELFGSKEKRGTVVLSVRVSAEELEAIEAASDAEGKTVSQVVREAVRNCLQVSRRSEPTVTVSFWNGEAVSSVRTGPSTQTSRASQVRTERPDLVEV